MKQFLSIMLRNQFNLFYRFGYTFVPGSQLVEFGGNINEDAKKRIIEQFRTVAPFEYDEEYLILHLEKALDGQSGHVRFDISDIAAIYPLSQQAKMSIESKIDPRIRLEEPVFEGILSEIETEIERKEAEKGISALWTLGKIDGSWEGYLAKIGLENIFRGLSHKKNGAKAYKTEEGNYWEHLIAYDRHDYFPKTTLGYFYDAGQVYAYSRELSTFEGSGLHTFLEGLNADRPNIETEEIVGLLENEDQPKSYVSKTTTESGIKQYVVAPLFLMIREEIRKAHNIVRPELLEKLPHLDEKFGDSFRYATVLLGAFFGFRTFYDPYYGVLNLRFHKNYKASKEQTETKEQQEKTVGKAEKQATEKQPETTDEEPSVRPNIQQDGNIEVGSENYVQKTIRKSLADHKDVKLKDIADTIKNKTRKKIKIEDLVKEAERMEGIEVFKKGGAWRVRRKEQMKLL